MFEDNSSFLDDPACNDSPAYSTEGAATPTLPGEAEPYSSGETFPDPGEAESGELSGSAAEASDSNAPEVLTVDDFAALEERILRTVILLRRERQGRIAAEERALALEAQLGEAQAKFVLIEELQQEMLALRTEREQVRHRVERLLSQLDALEL